MALKIHKHKYTIINIRRAEKRGMVIVKYHCTNWKGECKKPYITKQESEEKYR